ncbi:MAG: DUF3343 domain-containing protein [bacterium]|nr:DUF3343 domain-containing protein [bacterium]
MYIVTGSVTSAVRLKRVLEGASGYPAEVVHTPAQIKRGGCSYSVLADDRLRDFVRPFCAEKDIPVKGIYVREGDEFYAVP